MQEKARTKAGGSANRIADLGNPDAKPITTDKLTKKFFMTLKTGY